MTELDLVDTIADDLKWIFAGWTIKGKGDVMRPVRTFKQYLPQSSGVLASKAVGVSGYTEDDFESYFPCIIVKYVAHTDNEQSTTNQSMTNISLLLGIYDEAPECQGYRDLLNMIDAIRCRFLTQRVIGNKFWLSVPMVSKLLDADTWPVYYGQVDMSFATGRPIMGKDFFTKEAV